MSLLSLQECERDNIHRLREGEDGSQEPVRPGQSQRQGSRHREVLDRPLGFKSSVELSIVIQTEMFLLCRANSQDMETFKTEVHVPPGSNIEFELHYQEMMHRKLNFYEHSLYLQPGRLVPQFQVRISQLTGTFARMYVFLQSFLTWSLFRWMCTSLNQRAFPW